MKQLFIFIFCFFSALGYSQEYSSATPEEIEKYEKTDIGKEVRIYMQVIKFEGKEMGTILENKNWKYKPKKDLLIIGIVTEKFMTKGPNLFFKVKFMKIFKGGKSIPKINVLLEDMSVGNEYILNIQDLRIK